jgi:hypothetical protein
MSDKITADYTTLLHQASETAHEYFTSAIHAIDGKFGDGYAESHPELIAAFMRAAGSDFQTSVIAKSIQDGLDDLAHAIRDSRGE